MSHFKTFCTFKTENRQINARFFSFFAVQFAMSIEQSCFLDAYSSSSSRAMYRLIFATLGAEWIFISLHQIWLNNTAAWVGQWERLLRDYADYITPVTRGNETENGPTVDQESDTPSTKNKTSRWTETRRTINILVSTTNCSPWRHLTANINHRFEEGNSDCQNVNEVNESVNQSIDTVKICQYYFNFELPSSIIEKRRNTFVACCVPVS